MKNKVKLLDVVALKQELPEKDLQLGQVGTVVEVLAPDVYEVEFTDNDCRTYAELALRIEQLLVLHYEPAFARVTGLSTAYVGLCGLPNSSKHTYI
jgi:hypothetical protein